MLAPDPNEKTIVVEVKEKLAGEFNLGVSYGSVDKIRGKVQAQTSNLAGTGRQLGSTIAMSFIQQRTEGSFSEPWTFGTRWRTDLNAYLQYEEEPGYDIRRYGGTATVGYLIARVPHAIFFGLLTCLTAFIPSVGTAIVALPVPSTLKTGGVDRGASRGIAGAPSLPLPASP